MGNVQFYDSKILFDTNKVAMHADCCCELPCGDCPQYFCVVDDQSNTGVVERSGAGSCCWQDSDVAPNFDLSLVLVYIDGGWRLYLENRPGEVLCSNYSGNYLSPNSPGFNCADGGSFGTIPANNLVVTFTPEADYNDC